MRAYLSSSRNSTKSLPANSRSKQRSALRVTDREVESNNLLRESGAFAQRQRNVHTQTQLVRKMASDKAGADIVVKPPASGAASGLSDYLFDRVVSEMSREASLTPQQELCFRLYESGVSVRAIGSVLGINRMRVHRQLKIARHRLRAVYGKYDCYGWEDVYWAEVHRE